MHGRKITYLLLLVFHCAAAQRMDYRTADSLTWKYYLAGEWAKLDSAGDLALDNHVDYPYLRMRLGYSAFVNGNYSRSLLHYEKALKEDKGNSFAAYYLAQNNRNLGRDDEAAFYASRTDDSLARKTGLRKYDLSRSADGEMSVGFPSVATRSDAVYARFGFGTQIGWRLSMYNSVDVFRQDFTSTLVDTAFRPPPGFPPPPHPPVKQVVEAVRQYRYYTKWNYQLNGHFSVWASGNFSKQSDAGTISHFYIGMGGVNYAFAYGSISGESAYGKLEGNTFTQYGGSFVVYPSGNLGWYVFMHGALTNDGGRTGYDVTPGFGFSPGKKIWMEARVNFGNSQSYLSGEGYYFYRLIDQPVWSGTLSAGFPLGNNVQLMVHYNYSQSAQKDNNSNYYQNTITGGLSWKR